MWHFNGALLLLTVLKLISLCEMPNESSVYMYAAQCVTSVLRRRPLEAAVWTDCQIS